MKKFIITLIFTLGGLFANAQYAAINAVLDHLEERRGLNKNLNGVNLDNSKFVLIKDFDDHTERNFIIIKKNLATYVEMFDDKQTGQSNSNVFSGDVVRTQHNIISLRADKLEGERIAMPVTKTFMLTKQKKVLYLIDVNTKDRWIEEGALTKK